MADRMIVMNAGIAEQIGTPLEVYETPQTLFAAQFIGSPAMNILDAEMRGEQVYLGETPVLEAGAPDGPVKLGIRPEHLDLDPDGPIRVTVRLTEPLGANTLLHGRIAGSTDDFTISLPGVHPFESVGGDMGFRVQDGQAHLFDPTTGRRIAS